MIVSFSGIDSAGKSTQIDLLCKYCEEHKIKYKKVWSKARGTPGVILLKELVRKDKQMDSEKKAEYRAEVFRNSRTRNLLYIACMLDLCWYWGIYYRILNLTNQIVICDRYLWDSYVEMKEKDFRGIDIDHSLLWKLVKSISPKPKKSFVFIIPPEESLRRDNDKQAAGIEQLAVKQQKINCYMECIQKNCWTNIMDGMRPIMELHSEVLQTLGFERG